MTIAYTTHLRSDGDKMASAVARDLDAHVPTCPDWNVAKLTIHTGQHHRWVADAVRKRGEPPDNPPKPGSRGDELVEWFRQGWSELADLLEGVADDSPAWSWSGDHRAGFWRRRTALETLVHRWDAENATGEPSPLDPELAADGVDEMLFVMVAGHDSTYAGPRVRAAIEASDTGAAWTLDLTEGEPPHPRRGSAQADPAAPAAHVSGPAEDLLLFLWGRRGPESVDLGGDEEAVAALREWVER